MDDWWWFSEYLCQGIWRPLFSLLGDTAHCYTSTQFVPLVYCMLAHDIVLYDYDKDIWNHFEIISASPGSSWITFDHLGSSWIILDHLGSLSIILDHLGSSWIILDHFWSSWIILDHLGSSWTILDHLGSLSIILDHLGPSWIILDHLGLFWIINESSYIIFSS